MANERIEAALSQINESTNVMADATLNIADDIRRIKEKIGTGMTDAEVEAVTTRLEASAATLMAQAAALQAIAAETPEEEEPPVDPNA